MVYAYQTTSTACTNGSHSGLSFPDDTVSCDIIAEGLGLRAHRLSCRDTLKLDGDGNTYNLHLIST